MIRVLNKYRDDCSNAVSIMRPSPLGNPFRLVEQGGSYTRKDSVAGYEAWLRAKLTDDVVIRDQMNQLFRRFRLDGYLNLVCCCAPRACHGDVVKKILYEAVCKVTGAPLSYYEDNPDLVFCNVCELHFDPTAKGFHTDGCTGCSPA